MSEMSYTQRGTRQADSFAPFEEELLIEHGESTIAVPVTGLELSRMMGNANAEGTVDIDRVYFERAQGRTGELYGYAWDPTDWMTVFVLTRDTDAEFGWTVSELGGRSTAADQHLLWDRPGWVEDFFGACAREGIDPAAMLDWFQTTVGLQAQTEWADQRGVPQQSISQNRLNAEGEPR